jgi:hypothetical protein
MDVTMADLTGPGITDAEIATILNTAYSEPSFLTKFYFGGQDGFYDADGDGSYDAGAEYLYDPDGDGVFNAANEPVESAAAVFANAARSRGLNPFILLVHAQREKQLISAPSPPPTSTLNKAMGVEGISFTFRGQINASAARTADFKAETGIRDNPQYPIPATGPIFFFSRIVPIEKASLV